MHGTIVELIAGVLLTLFPRAEVLKPDHKSSNWPTTVTVELRRFSLTAEFAGAAQTAGTG